MTHFRFRYKRFGYMRWRCRTASRQAKLLVLPFPMTGTALPSTAAWRLEAEATVFCPASRKLQIGQFVVSEEWDPQLTGHPDIRY